MPKPAMLGTNAARPVRISQMPSNRSPMFLVTLMILSFLSRNVNADISALRTQDRPLAGFYGFGHMRELLSHQILALMHYFLGLVLSSSSEFFAFLLNLRDGIFHQFSRPIAQLETFLLNLRPGSFSRLRGKEQHRHSPDQTADKHPGCHT